MKKLTVNQLVKHLGGHQPYEIFTEDELTLMLERFGLRVEHKGAPVAIHYSPLQLLGLALTGKMTAIGPFEMSMRVAALGRRKSDG